ncbi:hypothetical protein QCA50_012081 [Cerrena zonata]|uniref:DM2 domain-containing protein n=1 Tax=Cerrena zonata TaxID=2478898 RepID=A0AAW0G5F3_9APHY
MAGAQQAHPGSVPSNAMPRTNTGPAPSISYSPTDTVIPPQLYDKVSDLELYKKLQEAERQVDLLITKKGLDFQAIHAKSIQPSNFKNDTGILRVFVYNTCENQPWQRQLLQEQGQPVPDPTAAESLWTLRVEGRFISDENNSEQQDLKFSNFLSGLSIDLLPNSDYPDLQNSQLNLIEYRDETSQIPGINSLQAAQARQQFDGFDVKRPGVFNIKTKIALMVKDQSGKLKLSDEMAQFIGKKEATQQELVYLVWQYVLYKDLFKNRDSFPKVPAVSASSIANSNGISVNQNGEEEDLSIIENITALSKFSLDVFESVDKFNLFLGLPKRLGLDSGSYCTTFTELWFDMLSKSIIFKAASVVSFSLVSPWIASSISSDSRSSETNFCGCIESDT